MKNSRGGSGGAFIHSEHLRLRPCPRHCRHSSEQTDTVLPCDGFTFWGQREGTVCGDKRYEESHRGLEEGGKDSSGLVIWSHQERTLQAGSVEKQPAT